MTILIVLLGLLISHLVFPIARWRQFAVLMRPVHWARRRYPQAGWVVAVAVVLTSLLLALILNAVAEAALGEVGLFLVALATFIYALGPRDLDRDVEALLIGGATPRQLKARRSMRLRSDAGAAEAAAGIFHAAQARWFGILFWFVLLGIPGALLYRLTRVSLREPGLSPAQVGYLLRLRSVLDWPVLFLMLFSAALGGDFERVRRAWHAQGREASTWRLESVVLDDMAALLIDPAERFEDGVRAGHQLVWRMLLIWLVVLSLLLIVGWLS